MRNPKNKTYKKPAAVFPLNLEQTLAKLAISYPNGIPRIEHYWQSRVAGKMKKDDIDLILTASNNSFASFQNLISNSEEVQRLFQTKINNVISSWFNRLNEAKRSIELEIKRKEAETKRRAESKAKQAAIRAEFRAKRAANLAKEKSKLRKRQEQEKKKAKQNFVLMKQLNLSADQKRIFKQLAK